MLPLLVSFAPSSPIDILGRAVDQVLNLRRHVELQFAGLLLLSHLLSIAEPCTLLDVAQYVVGEHGNRLSFSRGVLVRQSVDSSLAYDELTIDS